MRNAVDMSRSYHIRKGDTVLVTAGKEKGKRGKVLRIITKKNRAVVEKVNMIKRHSRPSAQNPQGGIVEREGPIFMSMLLPVCSKCQAPVRIRKKMLEDGRRVRVCNHCGEILEAS